MSLRDEFNFEYNVIESGDVTSSRFINKHTHIPEESSTLIFVTKTLVTKSCGSLHHILRNHSDVVIKERTLSLKMTVKPKYL
jgi:hypothetical protein